MRMLAIETASEACSIALFEGESMVAHDHRVIGRGHAEALVPMIAALPDKGRAARVLVGLGPGSFTGVRIGLATARALGFAWGAQVLGYPTLALMAAQAQTDHPAKPLTVCIHGGHGEWFVQDFDTDGVPASRVASLAPDAAAQRPVAPTIAGNRAEALAALVSGERLVLPALLPDARAVPLVKQDLFTANLAPIYGRGADATPMAERAPA
ncbi:tRNA (adenosine(37)-N6)-threonylcarbamoyltransferase complex dimerization subunit type 1 TsaB [Porphyrobacter sp. HT-58-2]|uniref:tRNA (adenosine(37)-N6)-threonylcarbamoyltransferase complex dimerization subunit type 1 TsaB n=1 Tax=Porphyrobacter sp. HT-58-2 TaxID=2023229 RepID=UPI000CDC47CD|nr:tRNA (adenosine(37)-N6)-threonylcarbamoyltransferase complex dimerization subunit type 1 TsaB [Porphyrobacter sp. HT-58-2]AUX70297.1 tRNA (adenosine(37)-N6)-threonylcarbamoyltransferase complex dimerization subunit type 1 TsaB [Porphyrobacter sp. HT-58-2]